MMEKHAALLERAGALIAEADDLDRAVREIEQMLQACKYVHPIGFDRRIFDLRARLVSLQAGLQVIADRLGLSFYR